MLKKYSLIHPPIHHPLVYPSTYGPGHSPINFLPSHPSIQHPCSQCLWSTISVLDTMEASEIEPKLPEIVCLLPGTGSLLWLSTFVLTLVPLSAPLCFFPYPWTLYILHLLKPLSASLSCLQQHMQSPERLSILPKITQQFTAGLDLKPRSQPCRQVSFCHWGPCGERREWALEPGSPAFGPGSSDPFQGVMGKQLTLWQALLRREAVPPTWRE